MKPIVIVGSGLGIVLSTVGLKPRIALAQEAGIRVGRGIVTDRYLQTSTPDAFALGDCAEVGGLNLPRPSNHARRADSRKDAEWHAHIHRLSSHASSGEDARAARRGRPARAR